VLVPCENTFVRTDLSRVRHHHEPVRTVLNITRVDRDDAVIRNLAPFRRRCRPLAVVDVHSVGRNREPVGAEQVSQPAARVLLEGDPKIQSDNLVRTGSKVRPCGKQAPMWMW
jgi:hypothetical protein